ncbi:cation diffusion facilitator family transporter [Pediococcus ethanolidurans]|uniref:cation diffusion facilitator family transporter n=1 Tax=Pediococcus ethanolidurans TaxID=319653 RepID=UPI001C1F0488|nr:cation diffusion facilitator family transporter [Pediococcus ethanolidurans]MBU7564189.1 cation transporter [Pediococcus ethanolidurans]MCV3315532.1 cation diffusion facilitator family transporter [Pediococcus ethanolidurans]MCV3327942.1 cation diffusion facilitator family transporter [Pediococcus ethanolidurans]MDV7718656.1 cation diffusion facilitator family transporter [Pediococcus ethanolidurans]
MYKNSRMSGLRFLLVTVLNALITVVELIGGLLSGSLALLSDAFHNLGDSASVVLAYVASRIGLKNSNTSKTFGYRRAEIISAFVNSVFLIVVSVFLIIESARRILNPEPVNGGIMLIVAIVGTLANFVSALLLSRGAKNNLNIKATYLHILSDAMSSFGIIIGAIIIQIWHINIVDPIVTILVSGYIMWETWPVLKEAINILMQAAPNLDFEAMKHDMLKEPGVVNVHHIHAWQIDENRIMFSAHINLNDQLLSDVEPIYRHLENLLQKKYHVDHVTLQAEVFRGKSNELFTRDRHDI